MLKKPALLVISTLIAGGLCMADVNAKNAGMKARGHVMKQSFSASADADVVPRRSLRRSDRFTDHPRGWRRGKAWWKCTNGGTSSTNCVPPGQRQFLD
jgi:hypothetical protein